MFGEIPQMSHCILMDKSEWLVIAAQMAQTKIQFALLLF